MQAVQYGIEVIYGEPGARRLAVIQDGHVVDTGVNVGNQIPGQQVLPTGAEFEAIALPSIQKDITTTEGKVEQIHVSYRLDRKMGNMFATIFAVVGGLAGLGATQNSEEHYSLFEKIGAPIGGFAAIFGYAAVLSIIFARRNRNRALENIEHGQNDGIKRLEKFQAFVTQQARSS